MLFPVTLSINARSSSLLPDRCSSILFEIFQAVWFRFVFSDIFSNFLRYCEDFSSFCQLPYPSIEICCYPFLRSSARAFCSSQQSLWQSIHIAPSGMKEAPSRMLSFIIQTHCCVVAASVMPDSTALFRTLHHRECCCFNLMEVDVLSVVIALRPLQYLRFSFSVIRANHDLSSVRA